MYTCWSLYEPRTHVPVRPLPLTPLGYISVAVYTFILLSCFGFMSLCIPGSRYMSRAPTYPHYNLPINVHPLRRYTLTQK